MNSMYLHYFLVQWAITKKCTHLSLFVIHIEDNRQGFFNDYNQ